MGPLGPAIATRFATARTVVVGAAVVGLLATLLVGPTADAADAANGPRVANGSFESPDLSGYSTTGGAQAGRVGLTPSFHGAHALRVSSGGGADSGLAAETAGRGRAGLDVVRLAVRGEGSSVGRAVRASVTDRASGDRTVSAPVHLRSSWQTVAVSAQTSGGPLTVAVHEDDDGDGWAAGDRYLVDAISVQADGPTPATTSQRQLLVDGEPFTIRGFIYSPTPPGGTLNGLTWNTNPTQCQSDAQLLRAAGVTALRILYFAANYTPDSYRRCMDAFHAAGIHLLWVVNPPGQLQNHVDSPAYTEAYWQHLKVAIERLREHPATIGYIIGNEMSMQQPESNGWFDQVDELARRAKDLDPAHVTATALTGGQFSGSAGPGGDGVGPGDAPNVDMWGLNSFGGALGYRDGHFQDIIDQDPSRPTWISAFGIDRYRCYPFDPALGLWVLNEATCNGLKGSGEDASAQADWDAAMWNDIAANLSADDPDGAVVGGTVYLWSDWWWFAIGAFTGQGTQFTHDVDRAGGRGAAAAGPDGFLQAEWAGVTHAMPIDAPGPRVTTATYDRLSELWVGSPPPAVTSAEVTATGPCSVTLTWTTDVPTYGRADVGLDDKVVVGGSALQAIQSENFLADRSEETDQLDTQHTVTVTGLRPSANWKTFVRGFDAQGRSGTSEPITFRTAPIDQPNHPGDCARGAAEGAPDTVRGWLPVIP